MFPSVVLLRRVVLGWHSAAPSTVMGAQVGLLFPDLDMVLLLRVLVVVVLVQQLLNMGLSRLLKYSSGIMAISLALGARRAHTTPPRSLFLSPL